MNSRITPQEADQMFKALAQPTRRRIMETLGMQHMSLMSLCEYAGVSQGTVSYHCAILREARLLGTSGRGLCVDTTGIAELTHYMDRAFLSTTW
ncbi:MAG: winged helix-turn-helix transcriptional regulator [Coriobacteriia bacterium]|nr:winged helix-turn-helix transcriptional regulator [Coriobacteriia bacterium]